MEAESFLDTHLVVWLYAGEIDRLSQKVKKCLEEAALLISPMVLLEIDFLHEIKRISVKSRTILQKLAEDMGLQVGGEAFSEIVGVAGNLTWTRDPFDRLIVAQAQVRGVPLLTKDRTLHRHYHQCIW